MSGSIFSTEVLVVDGTVRTLNSDYYLLGNKVLDGKFEIWSSSSSPKYWTATISGSSTIAKEDTYINDGLYSAQLIIDNVGADGSAATVDQSITLVPGWYYTLSAYVRNSAAGKTAKITLYDSGANTFLQDDGTWAASGSITVPNSFQVFTEYSLTFRVPNYENYVLELGRASANSSHICFDSVKITEASSGRPGAQYPLKAKEAEVFCLDSAINYGIGGMVPTTSTGIYMEPSESSSSPVNPKILKSYDEVRTFRAVRNDAISAVLVVNYRR